MEQDFITRLLFLLFGRECLLLRRSRSLEFSRGHTVVANRVETFISSYAFSLFFLYISYNTKIFLFTVLLSINPTCRNITSFRDWFVQKSDNKLLL